MFMNIGFLIQGSPDNHLQGQFLDTWAQLDGYIIYGCLKLSQIKLHYEISLLKPFKIKIKILTNGNENYKTFAIYRHTIAIKFSISYAFL